MTMLSLGEAARLIPGAAVHGDPATTFERVSTDSRTVGPGDLFVALKGERFDAHDFLGDVAERGAAAALVAHAPADLTQLVVVPCAALACLLYLNPALLAFALVPLVAGAALFRWMRSARFAPAFAARNAALERLMGDYAQLAQNPALVRQYPGAGIVAAAIASSGQFSRAFSAWDGRIGGLGACTQVLLGTPLLLAWVVFGATWLTAGQLPVGTLCVAIVWADGELSRTLRLPGDRQQMRQFSVINSLDLLRRTLAEL